MDYDDQWDHMPEEHDPRTYMQKVHDDNTWQKNKGILEFDGEPHLEWCTECERVVKVLNVEGSTVHDRYQYVVCYFCDANESKLRDPTEEELDAYDPDAPPDLCMECHCLQQDMTHDHNLYKRDGCWYCVECFMAQYAVEVHKYNPEPVEIKAEVIHQGEELEYNYE